MSVVSELSSSWNIKSGIHSKPFYNARSLGLSGKFKIRNISDHTVYVYIMHGSYHTLNKLAVTDVGEIDMSYHDNMVEHFVPMASRTLKHLYPETYTFNICLVVKHQGQFYTIIRTSLQRNINYIIQNKDIFDTHGNILGGPTGQFVFTSNILVHD